MKTKTCVAEQLPGTWAASYTYNGVVYKGLLTWRRERFSFVSNSAELDGSGIREPGYKCAWVLGAHASLGALLALNKNLKLL